jgi:hypothetical protein
MAPAYHELITIRQTGRLGVQAPRRAITEVVARHEAWRTTFAAEAAVHRATEIVAADTLRPYDLADGPSIRITEMPGAAVDPHERECRPA